MTIKAYGARAGNLPLEPLAITRRVPGEHDVQINIAYCGVCHSDLHQVRSEWAGTLYPCVPGHKVGVVGIGGLGHMGIKLANAMGAHVVAFTTSESKRDSTMTLVGAPASPHPSPEVFSLITKRRSLSGSMIGGIPETREMLDFCAEHNIVADIEMIRADQVNDAYERMLKGDVKYRFVIDCASLVAVNPGHQSVGVSS